MRTAMDPLAQQTAWLASAEARCDTCGSDASTERCCGTTLDDERPAGDH